MCNTFDKYQKIGQFRNALKTMKHLGLEEVAYQGTIKLHGTNAAIRVSEGEITFQSRKRDLSEERDNYGFRRYMLEEVGEEEILKLIPQQYSGDDIVIYGEFCGEGVLNGVGISSLPKMFVVFDVKINGEELSTTQVIAFQNPDFRIYSIYSYTTFFETVNVDKALLSQGFFAKLTQEVEDQCPVAAEFGVESGVGEGIVWKPVDVQLRREHDLVFKTKGAKHSASKVTIIADVTPEMMARQASISEFIEFSVTENRLNQGLEHLAELGLEVDRPSTGKFLSWVVGDITSEEADVIEKQGFTRKEINSKIGEKARKWFFDKVDGV